jgi:two-component system, OmpR family, phosphate regulon response regulator PhoB
MSLLLQADVRLNALMRKCIRHTFVLRRNFSFSSSLHAAVKQFGWNCGPMKGEEITKDGVVTPEAVAAAESQTRVMLVEDDSKPERGLRLRLAQMGFTVSTVDRNENPCEAVDREHPHLVIVDWDLPGVLTMNLIRHLRSDAVTGGPRLIALSRFGSEQHIISGFELGVDDYITRPYSDTEAVARVRAVLRPSQRERVGDSFLQFGKLHMDIAERRVTFQDKNIVLRHMEFILLEFLMSRPERAYSRELLLRQVWGTDSRAGLRTVDVTVQRVRRALTEQGCNVYLQTVRGVGYRLSASHGG